MKISPNTVWVADFETTTQINYTVEGKVRVWLWSLVNLSGTKAFYGTDLAEFLIKLEEEHVGKLWFHNLRFDGNFIISYVLSIGWEYGIEFTTIIDKMNLWYEIKLIQPQQTTTIWDSLKKFPGQSVENIAKLYGIKGKERPPDFNKYIPEDYEPTEDEIQYCVQDSKIVAHAL